ncbi:MAG: hypothetical protein GXO27_06870 [Chlorobi bacterium]|nr:hypothetical protein [Chlorobiota bacterium]
MNNKIYYLIFISVLFTNLLFSQNINKSKFYFIYTAGPLFNLDIPNPAYPPKTQGNFFYPSHKGSLALFYQKKNPGIYMETGLEYAYNKTNFFKASFFIGSYKARYVYQTTINEYNIDIDQTLTDRIYRIKLGHFYTFRKSKLQLGLNLYLGIYYYSFWEISTHPQAGAWLYEYHSTEWGMALEGLYRFLKGPHYSLFFHGGLNYDISIIAFADLQMGVLLKFKL